MQRWLINIHAYNLFMPIIYSCIIIHYLFDFGKSDKMYPCDLLLAEATETFSAKSDHSMISSQLQKSFLLVLHQKKLSY